MLVIYRWSTTIQYMEILQELDLSAKEQHLLSMHSALNVMNVVLYELLMLTGTYGTSPHADTVEDSLHHAADNLSDTEASRKLMNNIHDFISSATNELLAWQQDLEDNNSDMQQFNQSMDNLQSIFSILRIRARELAMRFDRPDSWETFEVEKLKHNYMNVLLAIEKNSKGRYRIVYNLAEHDAGVYLVNLSISSHNGKTVRMPSVFQDIVRDLLANARKYTEPGGRIEAGLYDSGEEIRFVISDTGQGIPANEIPNVIQFGSRASNALQATRGGGFGLTKAYYYTRLFGGRFWIDSETGKGTRIEIRVPSA